MRQFFGVKASMFRRNHRHFELEATRAKDGGYVVRISRRGSVVHTMGGDEHGQGAFEDPDSALDAAVKWVDESIRKARPKFRGGVS
jgi:hypothetical protein